MHVVGLRYENAGGALAAGALVAGNKVTFRHKYVSAEHPDAYAAYCSRYKIGFMPRFGSRLLQAAGHSSPVTSVIRSVSGSGRDLSVVVDVDSPFQVAPDACSMLRPTRNGHGVYAIVNVRNMKVYIGSTGNFEARRKQHLHELEKGSHFSHTLQRDWHADSRAFAFVIVHDAPADLAAEEQKCKYIYSTENPAVGYNQGGGFSPPVQPRYASPQQTASSAPFVNTSARQTSYEYAANAGTAKTQPGGSFSNPSTPPRTPSPANQQSGCMVMAAITLAGLCVGAGLAAAAVF